MADGAWDAAVGTLEGETRQILETRSSRYGEPPSEIRAESGDYGRKNDGPPRGREGAAVQADMEDRPISIIRNVIDETNS